jgi:hypothetical protein
MGESGGGNQVSALPPPIFGKKKSNLRKEGNISNINNKGKDKAIPVKAVEAHRFVRRRGSHIF